MMPILDYRSPSAGQNAPGRWKWFKIFLVVSLVAIVVVILAGAGGHGTYVPFKLLFPYTLLRRRFHSQAIMPYVLIGLVQFPVYGLLISLSRGRKGWSVAVPVVISLLHLAAVACVITLS